MWRLPLTRCGHAVYTTHRSPGIRPRRRFVITIWSVASAVESLIHFIHEHPRLLVLTGAGCSTDSGIPDYRDEDGEWKRARPVTYQDFTAKLSTRQRYWARSLVGFRRMRGVRPNDAHLALAALEARGRLTQLVTQNVDGLHQAAGSREVVDLHGRLDLVCCLACRQRFPRDEVQRALESRNPAFADMDALSAPDGDADLEHHAFDTFEVPACPSCDGMLKPDVVFFGESVPAERVQRVHDAIDASSAMLVVGSSLMVYSGFRFVRAMAEAGKPVAAVNLGKTRADDLLSLKVLAPCGVTLRAVAGAVESGRESIWSTHD